MEIDTIRVFQYYVNCTWPFVVAAFIFHITSWYMTGWIPFLLSAISVSSREE